MERFSVLRTKYSLNFPVKLEVFPFTRNGDKRLYDICSFIKDNDMKKGIECNSLFVLFGWRRSLPCLWVY